MTQFTLLKLCIWLFEKSDQPLGGLQQEVLMAAIQGVMLRDIAVSGFSKNYIGRVIAPELWKKLTVLCGRKVGIRRLKMVLIQKYEQLTPEEQAEVEAIIPDVSWKEESTTNGAFALAPHYGSIPISRQRFYSPKARSAPLKTCLQEKKSSLIFVYGNGGIGKTTLVSRVLADIADGWQSVFWCDLNAHIQFDENLKRIGSHFNLQNSETITELCDYLREHPSILVFDHWERLFAAGEFSGRYQAQYESYALLLEQILQQPSSGIVIVISREKATSIERAIAAHPDLVKAIEVPHLPDTDAKKILQEYELGDRHLWKEFITTYRGNPLKLRLLCATIQDWYGSSIKVFRQQNTIIGGNTLKEILQAFIQRTHDYEEKLLYWLMLWQKSITLPELQDHCQEDVTFRSQILDVIRSLEGRFLVEKDTEQSPPLLSLQPSIHRHLAKEFVFGCHGEITQAIAHGYNPEKLNLLNNYDLSSNSKYSGDVIAMIIELVLKSLQQKIPNPVRLSEHFKQLQMAIIEHMPVTAQKHNLSNLQTLDHYLLRIRD